MEEKIIIKGVELESLLIRNYELFKVVSICEDPTVKVKNLITGKFETLRSIPQT